MCKRRRDASKVDALFFALSERSPIVNAAMKTTVLNVTVLKFYNGSQFARCALELCRIDFDA